ncbi:PIN domain-containing protein [Burkholderia sp. BCC0322]|uniref:PIN domain-containing protein n=1 Tax=unclassified Burkholderia TaxID=2613784 RepID=UPI00158AD716|nr:PIN domain-containing protein [Burkholderia sp. BCC0322]
MITLYMLATNNCSFIMRERPPVVLSRLQSCVNAQHRIVVSAITYAEMRFGALGRKVSPKHAELVATFVARLDGVLSWDTAAIRAGLAARGTPIGANDTSIAGHAIAAGAVLDTLSSREFGRVAGLSLEDWAA